MRPFYNKCQIQTPISYVNQMLDQIGYQTDLLGKKVLENSFGRGNILCQIVYRYIQDGLKKNFSQEKIKVGLEKDIIGYEIDQSCIEICRKRLDILTHYYGIDNVNWNLRNKDFLKDKVGKVDFIIGNPPYITYHNLQEREKNFLKKNFFSCQKGRFDYYYAFIEQSLLWLQPKGRFIYLVPYGLLTNKFAENTRRTLSKFLKKIIDLRGMNVFERISCTPIIIVCQNKIFPNTITLIEQKTGNKQYLNKKDFVEHVHLVNETIKLSKEVNTTISDYTVKVNNSVATLNNSVFIFPVTQQDEKFYYIGKFKIEKEITKSAISPKSISLQKDMRIIFPYQYVIDKIKPILEDDLRKKYPHTYHYLLFHKKKLLKRNLQKNVSWYEFGRRQALNLVSQPKLVMPNIITKKNHIHFVLEDTVPYAGLCITVKKNAENIDGIDDIACQLDLIKCILERKNFLEFLMNKGTPTIGQSIRISVKNVQEYLLNYVNVQASL